MATVTSNAIPDLITAPDTAENVLNIPLLDPVQNGLVVKITVVTSASGIKFNTIGLADNSNLTVAADESVTVTIINRNDIRFKAGAANDTFKIEI